MVSSGLIWQLVIAAHELDELVSEQADPTSLSINPYAFLFDVIFSPSPASQLSPYLARVLCTGPREPDSPARDLVAFVLNRFQRLSLSLYFAPVRPASSPSIQALYQSS